MGRARLSKASTTSPDVRAVRSRLSSTVVSGARGVPRAARPPAERRASSSATEARLRMTCGCLPGGSMHLRRQWPLRCTTVEKILFADESRGRIELDIDTVPGTEAAKTWKDKEPPSCVLIGEESVPRTWSGLLREVAAKRTIVRYLFRFLGVAVILQHIGAREAVSWSLADIDHEAGPPFVGNGEHSCVESSIMNAVAAVSGRDAAGKVRRVIADHPRRYRSLRPVGSSWLWRRRELSSAESRKMAN